MMSWRSWTRSLNVEEMKIWYFFVMMHRYYVPESR